MGAEAGSCNRKVTEEFVSSVFVALNSWKRDCKPSFQYFIYVPIIRAVGQAQTHTRPRRGKHHPGEGLSSIGPLEGGLKLSCESSNRAT
jgi:hypothetical protein